MFLINKNNTCMWNLWNKSFPIMLPYYLYMYYYSKINIVTLNYTVIVFFKVMKCVQVICI